MNGMTGRDLVTLQILEHVALIQSRPGGDSSIEPASVAAPLGRAVLAATLRHDPPTPLELEHAIEQIEGALMPLRAQVAGARLVFANAALHALARAGAGANGSAPGADITLDMVDVETLFTRLAARANGRPATQDCLPTDPASSAALLVAREVLHHWGLGALTVRDAAA